MQTLKERKKQTTTQQESPSCLHENCAYFEIHGLRSFNKIQDLIDLKEEIERFIDETLNGPYNNALVKERYQWYRDQFTIDAIDRRDGKGKGQQKGEDDKCEHLNKYLKGQVRFDDQIDDEWMVASLLFRVSKQFPNVIIRAFDSDGEFLLIESSGTIPRWVEPKVAEGRCFILEGKVRVVRDVSFVDERALDGDDCYDDFEDYENDDDDDDDRKKMMKKKKMIKNETDFEALDLLRANPDMYRIGDDVDSFLMGKMEKIASMDGIKASRHLARVILPLKVRFALRKLTRALSERFVRIAVRMFYERTAHEVRLSKDFRALDFLIHDVVEASAKQQQQQQQQQTNRIEEIMDDAIKEEEEEERDQIQTAQTVVDMVTCVMRFSRCGYAQLARAKFDSPKKYPIDVVAKTTDPEIHNAFDIGMKLCVGAEIALQLLLEQEGEEKDEGGDLVEEDNDDDSKKFNRDEIAAILKFKEVLENSSGNGENSIENSMEEEEEEEEDLVAESDEWMRDGMRELENELIARAADREGMFEDDEDAFSISSFDDNDEKEMNDVDNNNNKNNEEMSRQAKFQEDVKKVGARLGEFMNAPSTFRGVEDQKKESTTTYADKKSQGTKVVAAPVLDADAFAADLAAALLGDPESDDFLSKFQKDLAFKDDDGQNFAALDDIPDIDFDEDELELQEEDFDVAYDAALREQLEGSHMEESMKRTTLVGGIEKATAKDLLKSALESTRSGVSGPGQILLSSVHQEE